MLCLGILTIIFTSSISTMVKHHFNPANMRNCQLWLSMPIKVLQKNTLSWKSVAGKFGCVFRFRPIKLKQFNYLTRIDTFDCPGGLDVTHETLVRESRVRFPWMWWNETKNCHTRYLYYKLVSYVIRCGCFLFMLHVFCSYTIYSWCRYINLC